MSTDRLAVVTGASSGIGAATATALVAAGFEVLAGVRRAGAAPAGTTEVRVDITDPAGVAGLADVVGGRALGLLVNNAGIAVPGPVEATPLEHWRDQLEVNLLGHIAVTQALLPALRRDGGRVVNVSSIGGLVAAPGLGAYAASKFALEAVSDALRREVAGQGVRVVLVEPGAVRTPIWAGGAARGDALEAGLDPATRERYAPLMAALRTTSERNARTGVAPEAVAAAIVRAATTASPRTRYLVGRDAAVGARLARALPARAMDRLIAWQLG